MNRHYKTSLILILGLLIGLVLIWIENYQAKLAILKIFRPNSVHTVIIQRPLLKTPKIVLTKQGHLWFIKEPIYYKADLMVVNVLLKEAINQNYLEIIENHKEDMTTFGTGSDSAIKVTLNYYTDYLNSDSKSLSILLGNQSLIKDTQYVLHQKVLYLADTYILPLFNRPLSHYRNKKIIEFNPNRITSIQLDNNSKISNNSKKRKKSLTIKKTKDRSYLLTENKIQIDEENLFKFLQKIESLRAIEFFNTKDALQKVKLPNQTYFTITIQENWGEKQISLLFYELPNHRLLAKHFSGDVIFELPYSDRKKLNFFKSL